MFMIVGLIRAPRTLLKNQNRGCETCTPGQRPTWVITFCLRKIPAVVSTGYGILHLPS